MNQMVYMSWPQLDEKVRIKKIDKNQDIFDWFVKNLPARGLQTVTVVAGLSLFMLNLPMDKVACEWVQETSPLEDIVEMPVGRFTFFMTTGNVANLSCKFSEVTEDMKYVTWADVYEDDIATLKKVGEFIWNNTLGEKKPIFVEFFTSEV